MQQLIKLYQVIIDYLEKQILNGAYNNNKKLPSESELSEMFSVSRITAQRALKELELKGLIYRKKGSGSFVNESVNTFDNSRILHNPVKISSPMSGNLQNSIAFILPYDILAGRFNEILQMESASGVLEKHGYHLVLHNSMLNNNVESEIINKLLQSDIKGIILYPFNDFTNFDMLYQVWYKKFPIAVLDKKITDIPICSIYSDHHTGTYLAVQELINNGHEKIACCYRKDFAGFFSVRQRFFGYCRALMDNGIPVDNNFITYVSYDKKIEDMIKDLLNMKVTALCCEHDYVAIEIIKTCETMRVKIPDDLSIVGFDNIYQSEYSNPPLTTIEQDFALIGKLAAEVVIAQIENKPYKSEQIVPVKLICRKSIKKLI